MNTENNKKYLIRFGGYNHRYLMSFTTNKKGEVDDITTTIHQSRALHLDLNDAMEYKIDKFKFLKPEIVEEGTITIFFPTREDYRMMYERRLEHSSNKELADEILSRIGSQFTVSEIRARLGFCFGRGRIYIHYTDKEKEENIEEVFKHLKYGYKSFINGLTQYKWQCNENVEVIELGIRNGNIWIHKRYVIDFKYKTPLEMVTDKNFKFPTTGYKEGFISEEIFFGNTHESMEKKDGKTIITPFKGSSFNIVI